MQDFMGELKNVATVLFTEVTIVVSVVSVIISDVKLSCVLSFLCLCMSSVYVNAHVCVIVCVHALSLTCHHA